MSGTDVGLSVVIPCFNERERLLRHVPAIVEHLKSREGTFEIIIVDDGSRDDTAVVAEELAKKFPMVRVISYATNRGKGGAVKAGILEAKGKYVMFTDADQSTPISECEKLLAELERGVCEVAIGSRAIAGAKVEQAQAWYRELAGRLFGVGVKVLCLRGIADTQCGFKAMTRAVAQQVFPQVTSVSAIFDIEMLVVATKEGCRVAELPVLWVHDPDTRIPYDLRRMLGVWAELFRIRRAQRIGWPVKTKTIVKE